MARPMILMRCPLEGQQIPSKEGYQRANCVVPLGSQIIHLGTDPTDEAICMFVLAPMQPPDPENNGQPKAYEPSDLQTFEFIILHPGMPIASDEYTCRAPVRTAGGLIFLFEKKPRGNNLRGGKILVPPGALNG